MLADHVNLQSILAEVTNIGYAFINEAMSVDFCKAMEKEVDHLFFGGR